MSKERLKEVATKGGTNAHKSGKAYKWTSEQAREAGQRGAEKRWKK